MPEHDSYNSEARGRARFMAVSFAVVLAILILMALLEGSALHYMRLVVICVAFLGFLCPSDEHEEFVRLLCYAVFVVLAVHLTLPPGPRRIFELCLVVIDTAVMGHAAWRGYLELSVRAAWRRYGEWRTGGFEQLPLDEGLHPRPREPYTNMDASMNSSTDTVTGDMPPLYSKVDEEDSDSEPPRYSLDDDEARIGG